MLIAIPSGEQRHMRLLSRGVGVGDRLGQKLAIDDRRETESALLSCGLEN